MINDVARKSIHVDAPNNVPVAQIKEYDDFILKLALMKYNTPFDCTGQTATLGVKAPSGLFEQTTDITINKDQIDIKLKTGIVSKPGICNMELKLQDSNGSMTTASFFIVVNRKILNDGAVEASDEFDSLTEAKKMEPIRQENERGRVEAEKLRVQSETDRAAAETARVEAEELRVTAEAGREKRLSDVEEKATNNATQIADIVKYQANSNKDYECKEHDTLDSRLQADYAMMMDRFNKASLLPYENEFITASNSYEGKTRDNVIKGRTLQNLWTNNANKTFNPLYIYSTVTQQNILNKLLLKPSTLYSLIILSNVENKINVMYFGSSKDTSNCFIPKATSFSKVKTFTTPSTIDVTDYGVFVYSKHETPFIESDISNIKFMLLEGDYTNKPIPSYFEGIKSINEEGENLAQVSCGKNLFNLNQITLNFASPSISEKTSNGIRISNTTPLAYSQCHFELSGLKPNTKYVFKPNIVNVKTGVALISIRDVEDKLISSQDGTIANSYTAIFTSPQDGKIRIKLYSTGPNSIVGDVEYIDIQLEEGSVATPYEPYKEDRLPIKMKNLRSLPSGVCDTSDGVRRIGKVVLNGSENWGGIDVDSINTIRINSTNFLECIAIHNNVNIINDKLPSKYIFSSDEEGIFITRAIGNKGNIYIRVLKNKLATQDIAGFKAWLQANPITLYYELETPTKEEGNVEQLRTYDGTTNIFTEGSLIEPTISCKVPSNVQAVVMNLRSENEALNNDVNTLQATTEENNLMNIETNVNQEARLTMLELGVI